MENKNYLIIENNVVTNIIVWDGDTTKWAPPANVVVLSQQDTPAKVWVEKEELEDFVLEGQLGLGAVGYTWDGTALTTYEQKPVFVKKQIPVTSTN